MKGKELYFTKDSSHKSVSILKDKVSIYLRDHFNITNPWFVDHHKLHRQDRYNETIDIVFFGDFLRKYLEGALWPFESYRFWVLSHATKNVMCNLLKIPAESISVIPRYALFPKNENQIISSSPALENLYYVGQLRPEKNIHLILWTTYYLQVNHNIDVSLNLIGEFISEEYKQKTIELISNLNWKKKPIVHGEIENFSFSLNKARPILINLSSFLCEDFGLSVAQAEEAGWNLFLSSWGGHLDVKSNRCLFIPNSLICVDENNILEIQYKSEKIAKYIIDSLPYDLVGDDIAPLDLTSHDNLPLPIPRIELQDIRLELIKSWGPSLYFILRQNQYLANDSHKGHFFFTKYRQKFSFSSSNPSTIVLTTPIAQRNKEILENLKKLNLGNDVVFMQIEYLSFKHTIYQILSAKLLVVQVEIESLLPSITIILNSLENKCVKI